MGGKNRVTVQVRFVNSGNSIGNKVKFEYSDDTGNWYPMSSNLSGQQNYTARELYAECRFNTANLQSGEYTIRVTLYDEDGNTDEEMVTYVIDNDPPEKVTNVSCESRQGCSYLTWDRTSAPDCKEYRIYRKTESAEKYSLMTKQDVQTGTKYVDTSLTENVTYKYYITAVDEWNNESGASDIVTITAEADQEAPVVTAVEVQGNKAAQQAFVVIKAEDNRKVDKVRLQYYDEENDRWIDIGKEDAVKDQADIEWNTSGLKEGTYTLRACAWDKNGNQSEEFETQTEVDNQGPGKIKITEVIPYAGYVSIKWEDVKEEDFAYFQVERLEENEVRIEGTSENVLGMHITGLKPETEYVFRVVGYDNLGNRGEESDNIIVTTQADNIAPWIEAFLPVESYYGSTIPFRIDAEDNDAVKNVIIEYSIDEINWETAVVLDNSGMEKNCSIEYEYDISGLPEGKVRFRAIAVDYYGNRSEARNMVQNVDRTPPMVVTDLAAKDIGGCIQFSWNTTQENISHYRIQRCVNDSDVYAVLEETYTARIYYDRNVEDGKTYGYRIQAVDVAGNISELSDEVMATVTPDITSPQIYGFMPAAGNAIGENAEISVVVYDAGLDSVMLEYRENQSGTWSVVDEVTSFDDIYEKADFTWNTKGLEEGVYEFRAVVKDKRGNVSLATATYDLDKTAPEKPVLSAQNGNNKILLEWTQEECSDFAYFVIMRKSSLDNRYETIARVTEKEYLDQSVMAEVTYTYKIQAWDKQGNYSESEAVSAYANDVDDEAPRAILPEEIIAVTGMAFTLDGTQSTDNKRIVDYEWDMGNGDRLSGIIPEYTYTEEGIYPVRLTVKDSAGNQDSCQTIVRVYDGSNYGRKDLYVVDENDQPVPHAYVYYRQSESEIRPLMTDEDGRVTLAAVPGMWKIAVYKPGYLPQEYDIKVENIGLNPQETVKITEEELFIGNFSVHHMSLAEMIEAGIDFSDPENYNLYTFLVTLKFSKRDMEVIEIPIMSGGRNNTVGNTNSGSSAGEYHGDGNQTMHILNPEQVIGGGQPVYAYLQTTESISWLKDMFWVELGIVNQADKKFALENASASLSLPDGLELSGTKTQQELVKDMGTIEGKSTESACWYIRGNKKGKYEIQAQFHATLMPFGLPVEACFTNDSVEVMSGEGIEITISPEMFAYIGEKYYMQYKLTNTSQRAFYNLTTSFGTYEQTEASYEYQIEDPYTGEIQIQKYEGATYYISEASECPRLPVISEGEKLQIGVLEPGDSIYGTYSVIFNAEGDPGENYYELADVVVDELTNSNAGISIVVEPIPSHITKAKVRYTIINNVWGDPVDMTTGAFTEQFSLLGLKCEPAVMFDIGYTSLNASEKGSFGYGFGHNFESHIEQEGGMLKLYLSPYEYITFVDERSMERIVRGTADNGVISLKQTNEPADYVTTGESTQGYRIHRNGDGSYLLSKEDGQIWEYDSNGKLVKMNLLNGKRVELSYGSNSMKITEPESGMYIYAIYNDEGLITSLEDNAQRRVLLSYEDGCLVKIVNAAGETVRLTYDENHLMTEGYNNDGIRYLKNYYDETGRVIEQDDADEHTPHVTISYDVDRYGNTITKATDRNGDTTTYYSDMFGHITRQIDANGNVYSYTYNLKGVTVRETDGTGASTTYIYDDADDLVGIKDCLGNTTVIKYDDRNNITEMITPDAVSTTYTYDDKNRMTSTTSKTGVVTSYTYDSYGRVVLKAEEGLGENQYVYEKGLNTRVIDYLGNTTAMTYDAIGNITSVTTADGAVTRYEYDPLGRNTAIVYADGGRVEYTYDCNNNVTSIKDQNGNVVHFEYNPNGWLTQSTNVLGGITRYEYDHEGRVIRRTNPDKTTVTTTYDGVGNVIETVDEAGNTYAYTYDRANRIITETAPDNGVTSYQYYLDGKKKTVTYPDGSGILYTYDAVGNLIKTRDSSGHAYTYEYDAAGNLIKITDPLGGITYYSYDKYGRVSTIMDANGNTTKYRYDALGHCIQKTDALSHDTYMTYDSMGRQKTISVKSMNGTKTISYEYDSMGRVVSCRDEEGNTTRMAYDQKGNVITTWDAEGNISAQAEYDAADNLIQSSDAMGVTTGYNYDVMGNLTGITEQSIGIQISESSYAYDVLGRMTASTDAQKGKSSYTYDVMGNITAVCDPNGGTTTYEYDLMGRVTATQNAVGSRQTYRYNAQGLLETSQNARGQDTSYTYDALGRITAMSDEAGTIRYTYDAVGNILKVTETRTDGSVHTITRTYDALNRVTSYTDYRGATVKYSYDELGNLISLTYPGGEILRYAYYGNGNLKTVTDWKNRVTAYEYDKNGNLITQSRPDGTVENYTYDKAGHIIRQTDKKGDAVIQDITYGYDAAGNITSITEYNRKEVTPSVTSTVMTYDEANRLVTYNKEAVKYDADGNMTYGPL
ncbi:MAG: PKD domain-containing protein, partial [Lachnospiraceae bacterium]